MSRLQELTDEQKVIGTILFDRARGVEGVIVGSGTVADLAAASAWPGERTFGRSRTARVLRELHAEGIARRAGRDPDGVTRWELDERGWVTAGGRPLNRSTGRCEVAENEYGDDTRRALSHIRGRTLSGSFAAKLWMWTEERWAAAIAPLERDQVIVRTLGTVADDPTVSGGWVLVDRAQERVAVREQEPDLGLER